MPLGSCIVSLDGGLARRPVNVARTRAALFDVHIIVCKQLQDRRLRRRNSSRAMASSGDTSASANDVSMKTLHTSSVRATWH